MSGRFGGPRGGRGRFGGRGRGRGRGAGGLGPWRGRGRGGRGGVWVEKKMPTFVKIDQLNPDSRAVNLICQVLSVNTTERITATGSKMTTAECVIGDETGTVNLVARSAPFSGNESGPPAGDPTLQLKEGAQFVLFNSSIEMRTAKDKPEVGKMELVCSKWSSLRPLKEVDKTILPDPLPDLSNIKKDHNMSEVEYTQEE